MSSKKSKRIITELSLDKSINTGFELSSISVGSYLHAGEIDKVASITRSIGGLDGITSVGPGMLGPNAPCFIVDIVDSDDFLVIPERTVTSVRVSNVKIVDKDDAIVMTKEDV